MKTGSQEKLKQKLMKRAKQKCPNLINPKFTTEKIGDKKILILWYDYYKKNNHSVDSGIVKCHIPE